MNHFNNPDLDNRLEKIMSKVNFAISPDNLGNVMENGVHVAEKLLEDTLPDLNYLKNQVGENSEKYIEVAETIAVAATGCIKHPIMFYGVATQTSDFKQDQNAVNDAKRTLSKATALMRTIIDLPMNYEAKELVNQVNRMISNTESKVSNNSSGCFVATYAFDDYNSKEVLFLRYYRDSKLNNNIFGRFFISFYYLFSPTLVKLLRKIPKSKDFSRKVILLIIEKLK